MKRKLLLIVTLFCIGMVGCSSQTDTEERPSYKDGRLEELQSEMKAFEDSISEDSIGDDIEAAGIDVEYYSDDESYEEELVEDEIDEEEEFEEDNLYDYSLLAESIPDSFEVKLTKPDKDIKINIPEEQKDDKEVKEIYDAIINDITVKDFYRYVYQDGVMLSQVSDYTFDSELANNTYVIDGIGYESYIFNGDLKKAIKQYKKIVPNELTDEEIEASFNQIETQKYDISKSVSKYCEYPKLYNYTLGVWFNEEGKYPSKLIDKGYENIDGVDYQVVDWVINNTNLNESKYATSDKEKNDLIYGRHDELIQTYSDNGYGTTHQIYYIDTNDNKCKMIRIYGASLNSVLGGLEIVFDVNEYSGNLRDEINNLKKDKEENIVDLSSTKAEESEKAWITNSEIYNGFATNNNVMMVYLIAVVENYLPDDYDRTSQYAILEYRGKEVNILELIDIQ